MSNDAPMVESLLSISFIIESNILNIEKFQIIRIIDFSNKLFNKMVNFKLIYKRNKKVIEDLETKN